MFVIVEYLKYFFDVKELKEIFKKFNFGLVRDMMCIKEVEYKDVNLGDSVLFDNVFFEVMVYMFKLIECFIVINGEKVRIGCLLEFVLEIV